MFHCFKKNQKKKKKKMKIRINVQNLTIILRISRTKHYMFNTKMLPVINVQYHVVNVSLLQNDKNEK